GCVAGVALPAAPRGARAHLGDRLSDRGPASGGPPRARKWEPRGPNGPPKRLQLQRQLPRSRQLNRPRQLNQSRQLSRARAPPAHAPASRPKRTCLGAARLSSRRARLRTERLQFPTLLAGRARFRAGRARLGARARGGTC
ncbi:hypothetical protein T484DRAFT_1891087, partial [Baffinella frigidus]